MDKKLCMIVCPTGALITREQNPNQPYTPSEVARDTIAAYREGASVVHLHVRHENGLPDYDTESLVAALEIIFEECPDIVSGPSISINPKDPVKGLYEVETIAPLVESLVQRGSRYIETTVVTPISFVSQRAGGDRHHYVRKATESTLREEVKYLQAKGVRPELMGHTLAAVQDVKKWLIETGTLERPYFITMAPGIHHSAPAHPDPWGFVYMIQMSQLLPEGTVIGASIGGRNWLPLTVFSIMLGVDFVRVGMEDTMWLYPHKAQVVESNEQVVKMIANIATDLGREIATPDEARQILGLDALK